MKNVVFGYAGARLDAGAGPGRWDQWRPTVDLCRQDDFVVDRLELFFDRNYTALAEQLADDLRAVTPETEVVRRPIAIGDPWDFEEVFATLYDVAAQYEFDEDERYLLHMTTGTHVWQICLFLLAESRHYPADLVQVSPPRRQQEPGEPGPIRIIELDLSRYDKIASRFRAEQVHGTQLLKQGIETRNAAFNDLINRIERVALASDAPMLLTGPTGSGKTALARRIYALRKRRNLVQGAFVELNCATIRGDGAMSAMFGHSRGAYTGATKDRAGMLKAADGGVLFLDEIGELGLDEQAMLLRAIESGEFVPLGSDSVMSSRFQLIAGTNRDLRAAVGSGRFREDLLARIDLWTFRLPALRARPEDIEPNFDFELSEYARRTGSRAEFNRAARTRFLAFAKDPVSTWNGNFRDLSAAVTRMCTLASGGRVDVQVVDEEIARLRAGWLGAERPAEAQQFARDVLGSESWAALDRFDQVQLADVLAVCRQSRSMAHAGRMLFAQSRKQKKSSNDSDRVRKYLQRFGLSWGDVSR